jgi:hypothetical protein
MRKDSNTPAPAQDKSTLQGIFLGLLTVLLFTLITVYRDYLNLATLQDLRHTFFPCKSPITYSLGNFDERFDLTEAEFMNSIQAAEQLWEDALGQELFTQVEDGELVINLTYDYRQAGTERFQELGLNIQNNNESYESLKVQYDESYTTYLAQKSELDSMLKSQDVRSQAYTAEVERTNANGGATPREYRELEAERVALNAEAAAINAKVQAINTTADTVNILSDALNDLADRLNLTAARYNTIGDTLGDEFVEGTFGASSNGDEINIYQFEDQAKLTRVLAHELGHALGLDHVDDPEAVMYRLNESENASLTEADVSALKDLCRLN